MNVARTRQPNYLIPKMETPETQEIPDERFWAERRLVHVMLVDSVLSETDQKIHLARYLKKPNPLHLEQMEEVKRIRITCGRSPLPPEMETP